MLSVRFAGEHGNVKVLATLGHITGSLRSHLSPLSGRRGQRPLFILENYEALLFELLLSRSDGMLPFLAIALAVNDSINSVIAQVRMDRLDSWMQLIGR